MAEATGLAREAEARRFFELLYAGCDEGYAVLSSLKTGMAAVLQQRLGDPDAIDRLASAAASAGLVEDDVYHCVAVMEIPVPFPQRGTQKNAWLVTALWAELDYGVDGHAAAIAAQNEADAWSVIQKMPLAPSMVVKSGGGFHLYWLLREPFRVERDPERLMMVRQCNRALAKLLREAGGAHVDSIVDLARVLRPAGSVNWKLGRPRPVELVEVAGHRWAWEDIYEYLAGQVPIEPVIESVDDDGAVTLVPLDGILEGCPWLAHCRDDAERLPEPEWHAMMSVLSRVGNGRELAHEWSQAYAGYAAEETDKKFSAAGKPMLCSTIELKSGGGWCARCSNQGLIKSPISLSRKPVVPGTEPENVTPPSRGRGGSAVTEADLKNAHRLERVYGQDVFVTDKTWWVWDGRRWVMDGRNEVGQHLTHLSEIVREEMAEMARAGAGHDVLAGMLTVVRGAERVAGMRSAGQAWQWVTTQHVMGGLDADPLSLNVQNGTLDLRTGELREHDRLALLTRITGSEWHGAGAECPAWERFLAQVMPLEEGRVCLQRLAGLSVSGLTDPRVMPVLHGSGFNGKTVFLETVRRVLGDYAQVAPEGFIVDRKDSVHPTSLAAMKGARMVTSSETEASSVLAAAFVKMITGGEEVTARFMHKDEFRYRPEFTMWMATNNQPRVKDAGDAIWERLILVPFEVVVAPGDRRPRSELDGLFWEERAGILAWAVRGLWDLLRVQRAGDGDPLRIPLEWQLARAQYRAEEDVFGLFLDECCVVGGGEQVVFKDLMSVYGYWCEGRKERPWTANAMSRELTNRGFRRMRVGTFRGFGGLKIHGDFWSQALGGMS